MNSSFIASEFTTSLHATTLDDGLEKRRKRGGKRKKERKERKKGRKREKREKKRKKGEKRKKGKGRN